MSVSTALPTQPIVPDSPHREPPAHFVRWALRQLGLEVRQDERGEYLELPEDDRAMFGGRERVRLPFGATSHIQMGQAHFPLRTPQNEPVSFQAEEESFTWGGRFGTWLADRLRHAGGALHARPRQQPMGVNDVAGVLFPAYQVEGGQAHLAGCQLTDHPFLRLSFAVQGDDGGVRHVFVAPDGSSVSGDLVPQLGLDDLEPIVQSPPRLDDGALRSLLAAGRRIAAKQSSSRDPTATTVDPLVTTVAWVRHVEGRLQFTIGDVAESLQFSSWVKLLKAPPFVGKGSGTRAYRLGATDDGRLDAAEAIDRCQQSGRRVLAQELVTCSVTGQRVLPDFTEPCPVSGRPALRLEFGKCSVCNERVSNAALVEGVCATCGGLAKVRRDDPRLLWIFGEHPGLDRWRRWQLGESAAVYVAQAAGLTKRLLVVVDKESLAVRRVATAGRFAPSWIDVTGAARDDLLK